MNKQISVLIADENKEIANNLKEFLENESEIERVFIVSSGEEAYDKILEINPDVAVIDVVLSKKDGFEIIEEAKRKLVSTKFIVASSVSSDTFVQKAMNLGAEYYMVKPVAPETIMKRIRDLFSISSFKSNVSNTALIASESFKMPKNKVLEEKITNIFITVGIPAHIKGYYFLREAIKMAIETPEIVNSITKKLYPSIAERFDTSASKVERAIRHAIEVAWNRGKIENINSVFGVKVYSNNEKPTNGEFIALVADKMLIEG